MAIREWARRKNRDLHRQSLEDRDRRVWHSSSYHAYFEGYTEYQEKDARGKTHLRRVYTGTWYRQALSPKQSLLVRVAYVLLFLLQLGCLALAGIMQGNAGTTFYIVLPEIVTVCLLSRLGYVLLVNYLFLPRKMTVHDYKAGHTALEQTSLWLVYAFCADLALTVIEFVLTYQDALVHFRSLPFTCAGFLCGAVLAGLTSRMEHYLPY